MNYSFSTGLLRWSIRLCLLLLITLTAGRSFAAVCDNSGVSLAVVVDNLFTRPKSFDWQGEFLQDDEICFPSRQSRAQLRAYLLAPANIDSLADNSLPVVVIGPGSGSGQALYYLWSARELAGHGYIAIVVDPQGVGRSDILGDINSCGLKGCSGVPFQQASNFVDAFVSGMDYLMTREHPWLAKADLSHIGLAGHSLSARAAAYVQGVDERVDAVVSWDNLSSDLSGDAGVASGGGVCGSLIGGELPSSSPITPRVPAMGQASDSAPTCDPTNTDPNVKKTGYNVWREADTSAMQLVFAGASHFDWAQSASSDPAQLQQFEYYTRAWFDLYLKDDISARDRLMAREPLALQAEQILSNNFHSAVFLPMLQRECPELEAGVCVPVAALAIEVLDRRHPLELILDASGSLDPSINPSIVRYAFDTGDGSAVIYQAEPILAYEYADVGKYEVSVVVTNANALSSEPALLPVILSAKASSAGGVFSPLALLPVLAIFFRRILRGNRAW